MATPSQEPAPQMDDVHHQLPTEHKDGQDHGQAHPQGQQTPPNSADGKKPASDEVPSELSDLDLEQNGTQEQCCFDPVDAAPKEVEVEQEIEPDHYYGGGKIPVFKPTMDQFRDFAAFVKKVDKYGMQSGIVKIVPPQEWTDSLHALDEAVKTIKVKNPIVQEFHGSHGTYTQANIEKQRSYNLPQWKGLCEEGSHQPPARRGQRRRVTDRPTRSTTSKNNAETEKQKAKSAKPEGPPTPVSPESNPVEVKPEELSDGESLPAPKKKGRQPKSVSSRRKHNRGDAADYVDEEAFDGFDYRIHDNQEYTAERCEELETAYWKSLMYNNPIYGADMPGSLFEESVESWNVAKLPNLLDVLGQKVPGVNTAYLYLGMWKATFAWHLEDVDLYSINYIHFGAPKQWYSISQEDMGKFELAMRSMWPTDAKNCDQFLRHKTYLVSPSILESRYGVTVNRLVHYEGEFVITFPYGYHSGYNVGYNCAESVNFATEKWLDYGRIAKKCHCESDSVWVDVGEIERKMRGEVTPEYYEEIPQPDGASDLLTPPRSVPEKAATRMKKRKRDGEESKSKRVKIVMEAPRKIPCLLCPNDYDFEELLPTEDGKSHVHRRCAMYIEETSILKNDNGVEVVCDVDKIPKARLGLKCMFCREVRGACFQCNFGKCTRSYHPTCAVVAGVQVEFGQVIVIASDGNEYTTPGVDLRCKYHRPKRASNLPGAGLERDRDGHGLAPKVDLRSFGNLSEEVLERYSDGLEVMPKPRKFNNVAGSVLDRDHEVNLMARKLNRNDLVQFEFEYSKDPYGAVVIENRVAERMLKVRVLPKGGVIEVNYRHLIPVKKSSFNSLPAGIHPLPDRLARKPGTQNDLALSLPVIGTPFNDARSDLTWAEFEYSEPPVNIVTGKFDFSQPEKLWYYLGKTSTDSKAQYTDNPQVPVHNPRSQFLNYLKTIRAPTFPTFQPHHRYPHSLNHLGQSSLSSSSTARLPAVPAQASSSGLQPHVGFTNKAPTNYAVNHNRPPFASNRIPPKDLYHPVSKLADSARRLPEPSTPLSPPSGEAPGPAEFQAADLSIRTKILEIAHRTNIYAEYNVAKPEFIVQFLLGPIDAPYRENRFVQFKTLLERTPIYKRGVDSNLLPPQKMDMECREVVVMLKTMEMALAKHYASLSELERKKMAHEEWAKRSQQKVIPKRSVFDRVDSGRNALPDYFREKTPEVYRSPYTKDGYADWAIETYGVVEKVGISNDESLANNYFEQLSPENQDKITQECGSFVPPPPVDMDTSMDLNPYDDNQGPTFGPHPANLGFNDYNVGPQRTISPLDPTLHVMHADSPTSYPSRVTSHYQSMHQSEHDQDLFGDQQANQRFWGDGGPWIGTDAGAHDHGHHVMFGPHERPRHDYASSDMDVSRGPGSLHSMDMAVFGPEPDGNYPDLSP